MLEKAVAILPRLRTKIGLVGLIVTVGAFVATRSVAPGSTGAQLSAGAIGVTVIIFGQIFYFLALIPERDRAKFVLAMFALFCALLVTLVVLTALMIRTRISDVALAGDGPGTVANTLDDLIVTWSHDGPDDDAKVTLETDSARIGPLRIRVADHRLRIGAEQLKPLWPSPVPRGRTPVRVAFQLDRTAQRFGPFDVASGLRVVFYCDPRDRQTTNLLTCHVASLFDEHNLYPLTFDARLVLHSELAGRDPIVLRVHVIGGTGSAHVPKGFIPDLPMSTCLYQGDYPQSLVRYRNLHAS